MLAILLLLPTSLWLHSVGNPLAFSDAQFPPGQQFYLLSKLFALYAVFLVVAQVMTMLVLGKGSSKLRTCWPLKRHQLLAFLTMLAIVLHVVFFILAVQLRAEHSALFLLFPRFNSGFYDAMVSVGAMSSYLVIAVAVLGYSGRSYKKKWRTLHGYLVYPCLVLIILHSASIGSESRSVVMVTLYSVFSLSVIYILVRRIGKSRLSSSQSRVKKES